MQVYGSQAMRLGAAAAAARRAGGRGFALSETETPNAGAAGPMRALTGIDALLALQGVDEAGERRKRAVRTGRQALDALDELKLGLLSGSPAPSILARLKGMAASLSEQTGDARLDGVLGEIALRAAVELAKAEKA